MGKRKNSTTTIMVMLFLLVFSLPALAVQALTTTQMRENSIRIKCARIKECRYIKFRSTKRNDNSIR